MSVQFRFRIKALHVTGAPEHEEPDYPLDLGSKVGSAVGTGRFVGGQWSVLGEQIAERQAS